MSEIYGFFDSNNGDRKYSASDWALFLKKYFTNGVFENDLKVRVGEAMNVIVSSGHANINGYRYYNSSDLTLELSLSDDIQDRIDAIVLRLDLTNRTINLIVVEGAPAKNPRVPNLIRNKTTYDLRLAEILVGGGISKLTPECITDMRNDSSVCGFVSGYVAGDTIPIGTVVELKSNVVPANWQKISDTEDGMIIKKIAQSSGVVANIIDALTSDSQTDGLSAKQGKVLKLLIQEKISELNELLQGNIDVLDEKVESIQTKANGSNTNWSNTYWGTTVSAASPLNIKGTTKIVSMSNHGHSDYLPLEGGYMSGILYANGLDCWWIQPAADSRYNIGQYTLQFADAYVKTLYIDRTSYMTRLVTNHNNGNAIALYWTGSALALRVDTTEIGYISTYTSDRNKKNSIADLDDEFCSKLIMNLEAKKFKLNSENTNRYHTGFIAQDVKKLIEDNGYADSDFAAIGYDFNIEEGYDKDDRYYFLKYEEFIAPLVKVVQNQQKQMDKMQKEIDELKSKLS